MLTHLHKTFGKFKEKHLSGKIRNQFFFLPPSPPNKIINLVTKEKKETFLKGCHPNWMDLKFIVFVTHSPI